MASTRGYNTTTFMADCCQYYFMEIKMGSYRDDMGHCRHM